MKQSTYLCVIYMSRTRKKIIFSPFLLDFSFWLIPRWEPRWRPCLVTLQACSKATTHEYTSSCREDQRLFTGSQIVSKYCSILKTWWTRVPSTPPPLNHGGGMTFLCTSEGIKSDQRVWETSRWKNVSKAWAYAAKSHSTSTREYIGAKTVMHDIPCTFRKVFYHWI